MHLVVPFSFALLIFFAHMAKKNMSKALVKKTVRVSAKALVSSRTSVGGVHPSKPLFEAVLAKAKLLPLTRSGWNIAEGLEHLVTSDERFLDIISTHGVPEALLSTQPVDLAGLPFPIPTGSSEECYFSLLKTIIYQQLSIKAAEPILNRFVQSFGVAPGEALQPHIVKTAKFEQAVIDGKRKTLLNGVVSGLSESKAKYIADLTEHFLDPAKLQNVNLSALSDEALRAKLLAVKGLGPWSVDMFMMFDLHRSNVLPVGDLIVRRGIAQFHGLPEKHFEVKKNLLTIEKLCDKWAPYSSLAACYMWKIVAASRAAKKGEVEA